MARLGSAGAYQNRWSVAPIAAMAGILCASLALAQSRAPSPPDNIARPPQNPPLMPGMAAPASRLPSTTQGQAARPVAGRQPDTSEAIIGRSPITGNEPVGNFAEPPRLHADIATTADGNPTNAEQTASPESQLLQLLLQERALLENYGKDHPQVVSLRARIAVVREVVEERRLHQTAIGQRNRATEPPSIIVNMPPPAAAPPAPPAPPPIVVMVPAPEKPVPERPASASPPQRKTEPPRSESGAGDDNGVATGTPTESKPAGTQRSAGTFWAAAPWLLLGFVVLGLLFHVVTLICMLRRQLPWHDGTVRAELINGGVPVATPVIAARARHPEWSAPTSLQVNRATSDREPESVSSDSPIFRQLAADNLRLRADIAELDDAAA